MKNINDKKIYIKDYNIYIVGQMYGNLLNNKGEKNNIAQNSVNHIIYSQCQKDNNKVLALENKINDTLNQIWGVVNQYGNVIKKKEWEKQESPTLTNNLYKDLYIKTLCKINMENDKYNFIKVYFYFIGSNIPNEKDCIEWLDLLISNTINHYFLEFSYQESSVNRIGLSFMIDNVK